MPLHHDVKITTVPAVAAGTSTINGSAIDMAGYDGFNVIVRLGTPATNNNIRIQQCDTATGTYADLVSTKMGDNSTDTPLITSIERPKKQFLRYQITRGTSTTVDIAVVQQYNTRSRPVTQPGATASEYWTAPSEGTA